MSESPEQLREEAGNYFQETLNLMQNGQTKEAFESLQKADEAAKFLLKKLEDEFIQQTFQMNLNNISTAGNLFYDMGRFPQAKNCYELHLSIAQKLLQKDPENVAYQSDVAMALNNLGNLLKNMGRIEEAKKRYEQAFNIRQKLLKNDPENIKYQSYVAMTLNNLGDLLSSMGRIEEAKKRYEKALDIRLKLLKNDPENVTYQSDVAMTLNNLGNLLSSMGRIEEAKKRYEKALETYEKLLINEPENAKYQSYVSMTLNNLGNLLRNMGRIEEAKKRYKKALDMRQKLLKNDPENVKYQLYVAMTLNNLGNVLRNMGRIEEAKKRYKKALDMRQKLLKNDPENVKYQLYVAMTLNNLGNLLRNMGRIEEAKKKYEEALEMRQKLLKNDPENVKYQSDVAMTLNNLGNLLKNMGGIEEAKKKYEEALEIRQKLLINEPENVMYQSDVAITLNNLASLHKNRRKIEEAKKKYEEAPNGRQELLINEPENIKYQSEMARILKNSENTQKNKERIEEAKKKYEKALEMRQKLLKNDPENVMYQSDVAITLNNLGNVLKNMGHLEEAKQKYEKALEMRQKLLKNEPENTKYQSHVAMILNNLGNVLKNMGRIEEAKKRYEKALEMRQKLLKNEPESAKYQSYVAMTLNNLGNLLSNMGQIEEAKKRYEKALDMRQKLLINEPEKVIYQSDVAMTLNNLGNLLSNMGQIGEAKQKYEKALDMRQKLLKNDPENAKYQSDVAMTLNNLGNLLKNIGQIEEAKQKYEKALDMRQKLLINEPENVTHQSDVAMTLNNLGNVLKNMGHLEEAKQKYEKALDMRQKLLKNDPENVKYQSHVAMTLNNLGDLLSNMGRSEKAKQKYKKALDIYTEPMQYLTIGRKSESIIKLIQLNSEQAEKETNPFNQMNCLREAFQICKEHREFFIRYELKHERKLVTEAGLSSYIDFLMKNVKLEGNSEKRAKEYEKALQAVEKLGGVEEDETVSKLCSSAACYLRGRKLVNEALASRQPELELLKQAVEQFKSAKETYDKANLCFCVYTGLLKILEGVEELEEVDVPKLKELIQQVLETLPEDVSPSIRVSFENIPQIFEEKDKMKRKVLLKELDDKVSAIEYKALENLFGHVQEKMKDYFEEPFSPNVLYENWKLKVIFDDPEKVKGKLTIKAGDKILFNRVLSKEKIEKHLLEIDYLKIGYFPQGEDEISFTTPGQKKPVIRSIDYFESIGRDNKTRIFQCDCCNGVCVDQDLQIAAVQLKYHAYGENSVVKLTTNDAYHRKVMAVLDAVKDEADIVVFPEFSIPFDYLGEIQEYADETGIIVVAGSHYVTEGKIQEYGKLFCREFEEEDLRKNISPVVIPSSRIVHNEKLLGAREERELYFNEGMKAGKVNHIFRLRDNLNVGVVICYEYLNSDLRQRLIPACDIILVPQTNPSPGRFYDIAKNDLNNPLCAGNRAFVMANGAFTLEDKKEILGGFTGIVSTLDRHTYKEQNEGIISPVDNVIEQFVLIASINKDFNAARDTQVGQVPIKTRLIHIFEENEILSGSEDEGKRFMELLETIENCGNRAELKEILNGEKNRATIKAFSPLMHKHIQNLDELTFEEIKKKCCCILIPAE